MIVHFVYHQYLESQLVGVSVLSLKRLDVNILNVKSQADVDATATSLERQLTQSLVSDDAYNSKQRRFAYMHQCT